jgi:Flp pilus assembly protein TadG
MFAAIAHSVLARGKRLAPRLFRRLARNNDGAALLEFALLGPAFLALLVAILQTGVVFLFQQTLQTATTQTARLIMTGQAQTQNISSATFLQDVCSAGGSLFDCSKLSANIQTFTSFSGMQMTSPVNGGTFTAPNSYSLGGPGDIVLVQVFYQLPVMSAPLGFNMANTSDGNALITATAVFRNEPYQ